MQQVTTILVDKMTTVPPRLGTGNALVLLRSADGALWRLPLMCLQMPMQGIDKD